MKRHDWRKVGRAWHCSRCDTRYEVNERTRSSGAFKPPRVGQFTGGAPLGTCDEMATRGVMST